MGFAKNIAQFAAFVQSLFSRPSTSSITPVVLTNPGDLPSVNTAPTKKPISDPGDPMLHPFEEAILAKLYAPFADQVRGFILDARAQGLSVGVQCGLRTYAEQEVDYQKGRDAQGNVIGPVVTRARPGFSLHNFGLAVDIVFDLDPANPGHQWSWGEELPWAALATLGIKHGLEAGFDWTGGSQDKPHFENRYGFQIADLLRTLMGANQNLSAVWAIVDHKLALAKLNNTQV